ncbi:MAG: hypothetical protein SV765_02700 [Pseudomonadota bacterium]|nr:hypothetical protein [Pseudomonadota bacterium]
MSDASKKVEQDYQNLTNDISALKQDVSALVSALKDRAGEVTEQRKDSVTHAFNRRLGQAQSKADELSGKTRESFEERPWLFLLGAFLIGALMSGLFNRR